MQHRRSVAREPGEGEVNGWSWSLKRAVGDTSVAKYMPLDEAECEWDAVLDTNLKGCFLMTVAVAPHLVRPGGRIIYISSIAAFTGGSRAGSTAYAAAKAGLLGLTYGFARELSSQAITVNAVAPGSLPIQDLPGPGPKSVSVALSSRRQSGGPVMSTMLPLLYTT
jgi:NAD(P)-dependent dehydrogenase (short-subunit alcohol dehydrogenase family)